MRSIDPNRWQALTSHLDRLLELDEASRPQYLASLEASSPATAAEVRELLAARHQPGFGSFLTDAAVHSNALPGLLGRAVGPWRIDAEIGHGGMGTVWRAVRSDGRFEARVAIKFLHASWFGRSGEQRFRQEGTLLGRLDHPNIAKLIDAGVLDGAQPYLVLEYVEGDPIDRYCESRGLRIDARVRLMVAVANAVAHAHSQLIVHRDLKPSNVFVTSEGVVKLLDFGISKLLDEPPGSAQTESGFRALTPEYAAPEQLLGRPVSTSTDVYSLGVLAYRLLTGLHPIAAVNTGEAGAALVRAVLESEAPRASTVVRDDPQRRRALTGDLDNILSKALKKDAAERYPTAAAFAEDLRRFLDHEPVTARADTVGYRVGKFVRRHRGAMLGTSILTIALIATAALAVRQASLARDEREAARAERDRALFSARRADAMADFTMTILNDFGRSMPTQSVREQLDRARALLERQQYAEPLIHVVLLRFLGGRYGELGETGVRAELLEQSIDVLEDADEPLAQAQLKCSLADVYDDLGRIEEAHRLIRAATAQIEALGAEVRPEIRADCRKVESFIASSRGEHRRALELARSALREIEAAGITQGRQHDTLSNALSRAQTEAGDFGAAVERLRALRAGNVAQGIENTVGALIHERRLATNLLDGGRVLESRALLAGLTERGAKLEEGGASQRDLVLLDGRVRLALGDYAGAIPRLSEAAARAERAPDPDGAALASLGLAEARLLAGELAGAQAERERTRAAVERSRRHRASGLRVDALLAFAEGRRADADRLITDAAAAAVDADGRPTPALRAIAQTHAEFALRAGRAEDACRLATSAAELAAAGAADRASSAWIGTALEVRSRCRAQLGDTTGAASDASAAAAHLRTNLGFEGPG